MRLTWRSVVAAVALLVPGAASAWPVWIVPSQWRLSAPGPVTFKLYGAMGRSGATNLEKRDVIETAVVIDALGRRDLLAGLRPGTQWPLTVRAAGSTVIAVTTKPITATVPAVDFDKLIAREFPELKDLRKGHETQDAVVTTSFLAKSVIQVGPKATPNYFAAVGHSLELIPQADPFTEKGTLMLFANALNRGAPAPDTRVYATGLYGLNEWMPSRYFREPAPLGGRDFWALLPETGGAIFHVMKLESAGDGVHFTLRTATLAIRMATRDYRRNEPAH